jgi:site-specific recombinase XerD
MSMTNRERDQESEPVGEIVRIFLRRRIWWANFQRGGRQHRRTLKTTNRKEARRLALLLEADLLGGRYQAKVKALTVDEAVEGYLSHLRTERRAPKTLTKYQAVLVRLVELLRSRRAASLMDLDIRAVDAYRKARVDAGAAPKTIYTETVIVRQLVNFAISRGLIAEDPLRGLKIAEPRPTPQPCWSPPEVERILAASPETHRTALTILADTGMRIAELSHLTWNDVDLGHNVLHVRPKEGWRPKTGDQRAIPMTARVRELLEGLPHRGPWVVTALPSPRYPRGDHPISERRLLLVLKRVLLGLGLAGHLHTFRHAFISHALTRGIAEAVVRDWVGHVDRDILRLYTHIASATSQAAMRRLEGGTGSTPARSAEGDRKSDQGD